MGEPTFIERPLAAAKKRAFRLGLSFNYGIDEAGIEMAFERGVNYLFWTSYKTGNGKRAVRAALKRDRERYILAAGPSLAFFGGSVRRACERTLKFFDIDYIDIYQLFWLGRMSAWREPVIDELMKLRDEGKVRGLGVSIHDRPRAGKLALDSPLDLLMIRYNAAHPGAERDIFPHLEKRHPSVIAYTATAWRKLLKKPSGWDGGVMTAGDCYRFCLSNPNVDVVLCGAKSKAEMAENLDALEKGPLSPDEEGWMRRFGTSAHG